MASKETHNFGVEHLYILKCFYFGSKMSKTRCQFSKENCQPNPKHLWSALAVKDAPTKFMLHGSKEILQGEVDRLTPSPETS